MAGLPRPDDGMLVLGDQAAAKFSVLCFRDGVLTAVESVNVPAEHMAARKLLAAGTGITRDHGDRPALKGDEIYQHKEEP